MCVNILVSDVDVAFIAAVVTILQSLFSNGVAFIVLILFLFYVSVL